MVSSLYKRIELSIFREPFRSYNAEELSGTVKKFFGDSATEKKSLTIPIENEWFEVDPLTLIEQECFQHERSNWSEEKTRKEILEAFEEARKNPERYLKKFRTIIPVKTWQGRTTKEKCEQIAKKHKGKIANWIEQRLQWAQCIINNEFIGWRTVCNRLDTANNLRIIEDKDDLVYVGGFKNDEGDEETLLPTTVRKNISCFSDGYFHSVPLIVCYNTNVSKEQVDDNNRLTFMVNEKEMLFSRHELEAILEISQFEDLGIPIENEWFKVDPKAINKEYFKARFEVSKRGYDRNLTNSYELILKAFEELEKHPDKYSKKFKVMFPTREKSARTIIEVCEETSVRLGHHQADWVEGFLQLAYIGNIDFEILFYRMDRSNWFRLFKIDYGMYQLGGSVIGADKVSKGMERNCFHTEMKKPPISAIYAVPLIVSYDD